MRVPLLKILAEDIRYGPGPGDPRTRDLPLMGSFRPVGLILIIYIMLVYFIGPRIMRRYPRPLDTYNYLVWHNLFLVLTNLAFGAAILTCTVQAGYNVLCEPVRDEGPEDDLVAYLLYGLFLLKLFELIDALTLVCRKIDPPFILVFHHTTIVAVVWIGVKYGPGGSAAFPNLLNSWVHVLIYMHFKYSRHYMSTYQSRKIFVMIYFVQFILVTFVSATVLHFQCGYPEWIAFLAVVYNLALMFVYFRSMWSLWCAHGGRSIQDVLSSSSSDDEDGPSYRRAPDVDLTRKKSKAVLTSQSTQTEGEGPSE